MLSHFSNRRYKTYQGVYHCCDNKGVLHNLDYCLLDTYDQYVRLKTAAPSLHENQAKKSRGIKHFTHMTNGNNVVDSGSTVMLSKVFLCNCTHKTCHGRITRFDKEGR